MDVIDKPGVDFEEYASTPTRFLAVPKVTLAVSNDRCVVVEAPVEFMGYLDRELRYKSDLAAAMDTGWKPPDAELHDDGEEKPQWDGFIRMLRQPKTKAAWMPAGLTRFAHHICERRHYACTLIDTRVRPEFGFPEPVTWPFALRPYQKRAIEAALAKGRGVIDIPPRGGKSSIGLEIVRNIALPTVWTAPTDRIVRQTVEVATRIFGKGFVTHQIGSKGWEDASRVNLVICTAATAKNLPQAFWDTRKCLFIDEFHHGAAKTYHDIDKLARHIYYRIGLTGTFFRSGDDELALHALLANRIAKIESKDLLDQGVLVPTRVVFVPIDSAKLRGMRGDFQRLKSTGIDQHDHRNKLIAYSVQQLVRAGRRVLVLVATKRQGNELASLIRALVPPAAEGCVYKSVEFVSTDRERYHIGEILKSFVQREEAQVLIGTSLVGEGVDLPSADALVYAAGGKAEVSLTQNAYRVCTASEGKIESIIVDFSDRHHETLLAHSLERLKVYADDPVFKLDAISSSGELPKWFEQRLARSS